MTSLPICLLAATLLLGATEGAQRPAPAQVEVILFQVNVGEPVTPFLENAYLVGNPRTGKALLIDPGAPDERIDACLAQRRWQLQAILDTHGHLDHCGGNDYYARKYSVKAYAHRLDRPLILTRAALMVYFAKPGRLNLGGFEVLPLHVPGHTPGSITYFIHGALFTGDTLFQDGIGAAWGSTESERKQCLQQEIDGILAKLWPLPAATPVYPGHGDRTTLGAERAGNPWLKPGAARQTGLPGGTVGDAE